MKVEQHFTQKMKKVIIVTLGQNMSWQKSIFFAANNWADTFIGAEASMQKQTSTESDYQGTIRNIILPDEVASDKLDLNYSRAMTWF